MPTTTATTAARPAAARLSDAPLPPVDPSIPPWPGRTVRVAGTDLYVRTTPGDGEPALYVHGLGGASTNWTDFAGLLSGRLAGEAIDLPGFGHSGPAPRGGYTLAGHARTVVGYLEQRAAGPVHLFGNSLGGAAAVVVAATRPDLVRTLTLVSPAMPFYGLRKGEAVAMPLLTLPGVSSFLQRRLDARSPEARARGVIRLCFADPSLVPDNRLQEAVDDIARRRDLPYRGEAFTASLRGLAASYRPGPGSLWRHANRVQAPTLVVWGDKDKLMPVVVAPRTAAAIPGSRLLVLPNVGHTAQLEAPDSTARAVLALLEDSAG